MNRVLNIHRGDAEARRFDELSERVIGAGLTVGLLVNFNVPILKQGIKQIVNRFIELSAPPRLRG